MIAGILEQYIAKEDSTVNGGIDDMDKDCVKKEKKNNCLKRTLSHSIDRFLYDFYIKNSRVTS